MTGREPNRRLAEAIAQAGWTYDALARAVRGVAAENGELLQINKSAVAHWVGGTQPSGPVTAFICEALSRRLGRAVTAAEAGFANGTSASAGATSWHADAVTSLADLGRLDVDLERRQVLAGSAYAAAALALPHGDWWERTAHAARARQQDAGSGYTAGRGDVDAVRETTAFFSQMDQRHGGGHGRRALVLYLQSDVCTYLAGRFTSEQVRRDMFSAAGELAYLAGWTAFDNAQHAVAQPYFTNAVKLAAMADDPPMAAHVLRAMAHQALELGHHQEALGLAAASVEGHRYRLATPREKALLGVVHARALAATGDSRAAAAALLRAEDDLAGASPGIEEPHRVFFFGEASLAHETARTLAAAGDGKRAVAEFRRSVRTRNGAAFRRTHAVTLGLLGSIQASGGAIEEACATWTRALENMEGIRSGRTRQTVVDMRRALSPFRRRGVRLVSELDTRAAEYLTRTI
ncbi:Tat pathway signal protein [Streptodolium elevatio]|uniref:Tat pathway signal protein n=1 Tax=Streptodolium elevatio TaxID=3157996 RepID=A0ABV3DPE1_9ACTN